MVSPATSGNVTYGIGSYLGDVIVYLYDGQGNKVQVPFYFTVYSL